MPTLLHVQFGQGALDGAAFRIVYYLRISEEQDMCGLTRLLNKILDQVLLIKKRLE